MKQLIEQIRNEAENNRSNLALLIGEMVRIRSYSGEAEDMQLYLRGKLEELGMETRLVKVEPDKLEKYKGFSYDGFSYDRRYSLIGLKKGKGGSGRSLILNGHVDVVPPGDTSCWIDDPLSGKYVNGRVYGRGALDMKGGLAAGIMAIKILEDFGYTNSGDLFFSSVCGEETGGCGAFAAVESGLSADGCIILEPTKLKICHIQSGCHTFKITVKGRSIHACMAYKGINVIDKFYILYDALKKMDRRRHERFSNRFYENPGNVAPFSVGTVAAGEWPSSVPDLLEAHGRMGIFPGETVEEMHREFEDTLRQAAETDSWLAENLPEIEWYEGLFEPAETDINSDLVKTLAASHQQILGRSVQYDAATYGSDMRIFNLYANIPTVLYGPGDVSLAHTVNEYIEIDQVLEAVCSIALMITNWCQ
ncbi:MAG: ArgE/DapE family deacylase [Bacillota bacterium]|nr:ArgE/DapE family deacylase [Bacillota bacterium]